ncbi:hypothetical protein CALVIDRAFT_540766 [Calocera viscosa TUFC12733]|uniref:F-box domain-containing protein n=1 Tax=Calocera viscosa (strain TUFC12733) TaxID=1330018 RepID=A0A167IIQ0_CALVF|nr:hypothetical protein CALVIDRAFT_540766 [Calocera viscosa TUFC12733]
MSALWTRGGLTQIGNSTGLGLILQRIRKGPSILLASLSTCYPTGGNACNQNSSGLLHLPFVHSSIQSSDRQHKPYTHLSAMTEDRDCITHAAKLREVIDVARLLVDKLSAVPRRTSVRSLLHQDEKHQMALQTVYDLEDAMQSVLRDVDELRNRLLSPSTRLHDELLQEVFLHCSNSMVRRYPHQHAWKKFDPVLLTSICRRWRTVALNTATLWAELSIESNSDAYGRCENPWIVLRGGGDVDSHIQRSGRYRAFLERWMKFVNSGRNAEGSTDFISRRL